jgi:hypothetical protein
MIIQQVTGNAKRVRRSTECKKGQQHHANKPYFNSDIDHK